MEAPFDRLLMDLNRTFRLEVKIISLKQFGAYSSWELTDKSSKTEMSRVKLEIFLLKAALKIHVL